MAADFRPLEVTIRLVLLEVHSVLRLPLQLLSPQLHLLLQRPLVEDPEGAFDTHLSEPCLD